MTDTGEHTTRDTGEMVLVYATFPTLELAKEVARELVQDRLAACVNIFPGMTAVYEWEGKLCEDAEVAAIVKTQRARLAGVFEAVRSRHPYANPALIALEASGGSASYLAWVLGQTRAGSG